MNADLPPIYLTIEELRGITGRTKATAQIRWLCLNGFTVFRRADGMPLVSRAHFEAKMGAKLSPFLTNQASPGFSVFS